MKLILILFKKIANFTDYCKIINSWNVRFSGYFWNTKAIICQCFFNLHDCTFKNSKFRKCFLYSFVLKVPFYYNIRLEHISHVRLSVVVAYSSGYALLWNNSCYLVKCFYGLHIGYCKLFLLWMTSLCVFFWSTTVDVVYWSFYKTSDQVLLDLVYWVLPM